MKIFLRKHVKTENIVALALFVYLIMYPLSHSAYRTMNMANFLATIILALSLTLVWGYTGIFSYAQAAFFGLGGYTYAILCKNFAGGELTPLFLSAGMAVGFIVAMILGFFMFYGGISGVFVALITMCFTMVLETFLQQTAGAQWRIGDALLGGFNGINNITKLTIGGIVLRNQSLYIFALIILLVIYIGFRYMETHKLGYTLISIREKQERSELLGYNTAFIQMMIFAVSGAMAALAGVLYTTWGGYIVPTSVGMIQATTPVVLVAAGGKKNSTAVILFSLLYLNLSQNLAAVGTQYSLIILGLILLVVVLVVPKGIFHSLFEISDRRLLDPLFADKKEALLK